jgi:hypothetical protein
MGQHSALLEIDGGERWGQTFGSRPSDNIMLGLGRQPIDRVPP